jgi:hypothetical protein
MFSLYICFREGISISVFFPNADYELKWIDRKTGIAGALFTQLMPPGDAAVTSLLIELEKATYRSLTSGADFNSIIPRL